MRGRKPKPTALHLLHGTFNRTRHGNRIDAPQNFGHRAMPPSKVKEDPGAEQRIREIREQHFRITGRKLS
jgi:hypothetical protein